MTKENQNRTGFSCSNIYARWASRFFLPWLLQISYKQDIKLRKAIWIGDSLKRLKEFPEEVQIVLEKSKHGIKTPRQELI